MTAVVPKASSLWRRLRGFTVTCLVLRVPEAEPAVAVLGPPAGGDLPAHLTIAYPFPLAAMGTGPTAVLERMFGEHDAFDLELDTLGRFDDVAYLTSRDPRRGAGLAAAVQDRFPGSPLYGGAFDTFVPHVSLGPVSRLNATSEAALRNLLPIRSHVREVELWGLCRGHWVLVRGFPLKS